MCFVMVHGLPQQINIPQFKFNGVTMNTIANIPTHTGYRTNATVSGLRFSSGNRYVGGSPVTASRKEVERVDANTVFLMTGNFKDVISGVMRKIEK